MMMDSLLYGDLVDPFFPVAPEEDEEKEKTTDQPSEKELEKMTRKVSELSEQNSALKKNISCLFKTAKLELSRKTTTISSLEKRIDILQAVISHAVNNKPSPSPATSTTTPPSQPPPPATLNIPPVSKTTVATREEIKNGVHSRGQSSERRGVIRGSPVQRERRSRRTDPLRECRRSERLVDVRGERGRGRRREEMRREEKENRPTIASSRTRNTLSSRMKIDQSQPIPPPPVSNPPPPPPSSTHPVLSYSVVGIESEEVVVDTTRDSSAEQGDVAMDNKEEKEEKEEGEVEVEVEKEEGEVEVEKEDTEEVLKQNDITSQDIIQTLTEEPETTPPLCFDISTSDMTLTEEDVIDVNIEEIEEGEITSCDELSMTPSNVDIRPPTPTSSPYKRPVPTQERRQRPREPISRKRRLEDKREEERSRRSHRSSVRDLELNRDRDLRRRCHRSPSPRRQRKLSPHHHRRPLSHRYH